MKNVCKLLLFLAYTISIFLVKQHQYIAIVICINILLTLILKISIKQEAINISKAALLILITVTINMLIVDIQIGIIIGTKLILVCNITYIFSQKITYMELAEALEKMFSIVKFLKINPKNISIMICICITFIPTIKKQINQVKETLKSKGLKINLKNSKLIFQPIIISLLKRVDEIESSLKSKAYEE